MATHDPTGLGIDLPRPETPFDRLREQRVLFVRGALDAERASELVAELLSLESSSDHDVTLLIDAPDGSFDGVLAVHDVMRSMSARVHTRCLGVAAGAPAVLLATGTGTRSASRNARVMLRQPRADAEGTADELSTAAEQATLLRRRVAELLAERTGRPVERIQADSERDHWLSAGEARDYGIVDEVA